MARDDLYIVVPSSFRCPILLDVMKSPVSLCTGVTYDRANIQRWLDSGNNTCPATMQVLESKDLILNRNLQRLIQIWLDSVACRQLDAESVRNSVVVPSQNQVKLLVKHLDINCFLSLTKIICFARESEENREFLAKMDRFFSKPLLETNYLSIILLVLQRGNSDSQIETVRLLESIAVNGESKLKIGQKEGLVAELVKSLRKDNPRLIEASLSFFIAITMPKHLKTIVIQYRIIPELKYLLSQPNTTTSITEKALTLLEELSIRKKGRVEIWHDSVLLGRIAETVLTVSSTRWRYFGVVVICLEIGKRKKQWLVAMG
ncbi:U-box domain-containing protein 29-like [Gossypium arboreum]|uniref:U-box domain-containing protein 29-like n=1 Tax=Gossypium arboreum TaxID=29729 RepID=UPI000819013C|nr:U-box domain-containing protein 29-like [Gossypium arboreum]